ncbi:MAG: non-canonical purine NTP pyrophosphatase [Candidatus Peribacteraceae bacterium]|nr:non-canonical purine NTP pyrophosphatase [Candidatus Peribacteraceae bacterium]
MQLLIGTNNHGKFIEISEVLSGLPIAPVRPADIGIAGDPEETGNTFAENALQKARFFRSLSNLPTVADDSGIVVEAIANELGLHTRRWGAGPSASDAQWIEHFLKRMEKEANKRAHFLCTLAYIDANGDEHVFEGKCSGIITATLEADYLPGLPISACFKPDGCDSVFSALKVEQKNSTSHRGKAAHALRQFLLSR